MFNHISQINLEELKKNHARLYYFGLGFIQLKIDETYRLHFYSPELPSITEDIHNHRYDFTSRILKGRIINRVWEVEETKRGEHVIVNESCNPDISAPVLDTPCKAELVEASIYSEGHNYQMKDDMFHQVEAPDGCITLLKRGDYTKEFAQIVLPKGKESVCPFSKKIDDEVLWKIMAAMLNT